MSEIDEVVGEFLVESHESLDRLDRDLLALENDPADAQALERIFRDLHTIKGTCGFLGFAILESVAHSGENLLGKLRDGEMAVDEEIATALLRTVDAIRELLGEIERSGAEGNDDYVELVNVLVALQAGDRGVVEGLEPAPAAPVADRSAEAHDEASVDLAPSATETSETSEAPEVLEQRGGSVADSSIRVDVSLLDDLMNLVGELVLARNQIVQLAGDGQEGDLTGASQRLNLVTTELQEGVMKTRMQPIGNVWNRFPRVVRDLALECGKQVRVEMEGKETELDKTIIEAIKDPLTHLVRNSVDHGIETPEDRERAGKPAEGRLHLRAFHEGGQVNIEISDDGGGIDPEKIANKAVDKGIITRDQASGMSEREAVALVFHPGFSTAEQVTNVSGRGVGMDVVKSNIEKIGGTVDIASELGEGTTFKVKIPLTLAIIPALVIGAAGDRFAIPQISLLELVRLEGEAARQGIEYIHGAPVHRLRGRLLPIVHLDEQLGDKDPSAHRDDEVLNIVVLQADDTEFGLVVDEISDTEEIVVKPLGQQLKQIPLFAGATIMGDGKVALILDVLGLAHRSQVVSEARERGLLRDLDDVAAVEAGSQTLLLVALGDDRRAAVPLSEVNRLEEFTADAIERSGHQEVVQYRGEIMPLLRLGELLGYGFESAGDGPLNVVVHTRGGRSVGLLVGQILDIADQRVDIDGGREHGALLGTTVIHDRVTDVVDIGSLVASSGALDDRSPVAV
ncbi:histidine kinase [Egibacter rhizosphaerae]|uniref:histidine kinase n=1 Tax=Egibacter rhizosphaerae TaxID=1670831 RepID=A0A411YIX2_9ACTN|nr:chemotaxis protein CheW [Egibacter rhizosphaerae]QBI21255.1 histidine kinase [Egibacter rhizosphaerae]